MGSKLSYFQLVNNTNQDIINTKIFRLNTFDWSSGDARPDKNLVNRKVPRRGGSIREPERVYHPANHCPFTMFLIFDDCTFDVIRIHQRYATLDCNHEDVFQHVEKSHDIKCTRSGNDTLVVTVENTYEQKQNERAERKNSEGEDDFKHRKYEEAILKFKDAKKLANQKSTMDKIDVNLQKTEKADKSLKLNEEGNQLVRKRYYLKAITKFDQALQLAEDYMIQDITQNKKGALNARAEVINGEGDEAFKKGRYETALEKFEKAHRLANEIYTIHKIDKNIIKATNVLNAQQKTEQAHRLLKEKKFEEAIKKLHEASEQAEGSSLFPVIENIKLEAIKQHGQALYEEGWILESDEIQASQALLNFQRARDIFKKLRLEYRVREVELKIAGNEFYNAGINLENEASKLHQKAQRTGLFEDYEMAQKKNEEALKKFKEAVEKFRQCSDPNFVKCVSKLTLKIENLKIIIEEIQEARLVVY